MATLKLGHTDKGNVPEDLKKFFSVYHVDAGIKEKIKFRKESRYGWAEFRELNGMEVHELQKFLKDYGFHPFGELSGIFGYITLSGVRLFQEYVRTVGGSPEIGSPDGIVGNGTKKYIQKWKDEELKCIWNTEEGKSKDFDTWIQFLETYKNKNVEEPSAAAKFANEYAGETSTLPVEKWSADPKEVHLIGIRRKERMAVPDGGLRPNDDLFILLLNGMVFKFWGSTDPNPHLARSEEPFLLEGQHLYRFGWHKISKLDQSYIALRCAKNGTLITRDYDRSGSLTPEDLEMGQELNSTINIHWSGVGSYNFSAGCQVISGQSYINHNNDFIDCSSYAAKNKSQLKKDAQAGLIRTKGAYNVLSDLVLSYARPKDNIVKYTLVLDEDLALLTELGNDYADDLFARFKKKE